MNSQKYASLRRNVSLLGRILGEVISDAEGPAFLKQIEQIRHQSKAARAEGEHIALQNTLRNLDKESLVPVARAFSQFLNLANIADQHHTISREMDEAFSGTKALEEVFTQLIDSNIPKDDIIKATEDIKIELVLTAHPTEISRRTLIHKYGEIDSCLRQLELAGMTEREQTDIHNRLRELITQIWFGNDFRPKRPTPVDEAKWGYAVIENSLWDAVPKYIRRLDETLCQATGKNLAIDTAPVCFASWLGGDRDGNPNVTAKITSEVLLLSRWQATHLYLKDLKQLIEELSMVKATPTFKTLANNANEPYRAVLKTLRDQLQSTLDFITDNLAGRPSTSEDIIVSAEQIWSPVYSCYQSLIDCGMSTIANSTTLDMLRRIRCFGIHLVKLDIRQESTRHSQVLSELCSYLKLGSYDAWTEEEKLEFLSTELKNKRPLIPNNWQPSTDVQEVLDTCKVIAKSSPGSLGSYVISMARQASDVLTVQLLLKETGCTHNLQIVPLFETLDDLNRAPKVMTSLLKTEAYRSVINNKQMVMIGYSDSAKDAGVMAASWAQYSAQESLLQVCADNNVKLTLFHGRGGSIGRGGAPAREALLSQPPGSLQGGLRVTEQGEMIRAKLGLSPIALKTFALYTSAILQANLLKPPQPKDEWREAMNTLSEVSCDSYRAIVREHPRFVEYFRQATPEQELTKLPLGSRPARRKASGGIESLRAIPWIFAWSQNRLMLPAWLGAGQALQHLINQGDGDLLKQMAEKWPFFATRVSMLEMVFAKADANLSSYYDRTLVEPELQSIGQELNSQLQQDTQTILDLLNINELLENNPWVKESIELRDIYTEPLNVLQAELLKQNRDTEDAYVEQAIMVTIAGVSAGMRNTG